MSTTTGRPPAWITASSVAMKVIAGTITSSPGSITAAWSASRNASSPLATPTQVRAPQYEANARSNDATCGPPVNVPPVDQRRDVVQNARLEAGIRRAQIEEGHGESRREVGIDGQTANVQPLVFSVDPLKVGIASTSA